VTPTPTVTYIGNVLALHPEWNFISVPRTLAGGFDTAGVVFAGIDTGGRSIFLYDGATASWKQLRSGDRIGALDGIWIYSGSAASVPLVYAPWGSRSTLGKALYPGWNSMGIGSLQPVQARDAFRPMEDKWEVAIGYDPVEQVYESVIVRGGPGTHGDSRLVYPFSWYWIRVNGTCTYTAVLE